MNGSAPGPQAASARSWPPIAAMGSALVLVFLVLPNPLRIPQNNPTASAEYAPVPGKQETATNANFGETGQATSGGVGAGGQGEGLLPGAPPPKLPPQFNPRQKECSGNPPQQTEDPLSPFCVPFFDGDNGGATWNGVTGDRIIVTFYNDLGIDGDMSSPYAPSQEQGDQNHFQWKHLVRTIKAQLRYFSRRYQTYGRRVQMYAYPAQGGPATPPPARRADALRLYDRDKPFATASLVDNAQDSYVELANRKVPSFGWNEDVPVANYRAVAPFLWSFGPDQETEAAWSASFICRKLQGRTAKFSDDPGVVGKPRKFALIWPKQSQRGVFHTQLANLLIDGVKKECGMTFDYAKPFVGNGDAPRLMATFKAEDYTTIICYCVPVQSELHVTAFQNAAQSISYLPEWYWDHTSAMDRSVWQQTYANKNMKGFGVTYLWRQPAFRESYAWQAYLSEEPSTTANQRFNFEIYHVFLNLFSAIQAAGPNLTPDSVTKGMFTFKYLNPSDPWLPTGSYGDDGPSPYTFIDTAMGWWWDPTGTPPGGRRGEGCMRVINEGRRVYAKGWKLGDADLFRPSDPCSEGTRKLDDPYTSTGL